MEKKKINLKEKWQDKKEKAKIELMIYGIIFLILIVFVKVGSVSNKVYKTIDEENNFINDITDNYEYDIEIDINNSITKYHGKKLGYNSSIVKDNSEYYYNMNDKYYVLDDSGNYILIKENDIFSIIDYKYLDVNTIKEYINLADADNNVYKVKLSDIDMSIDSDDYISITVDDDEHKVIIDYTSMFDKKAFVTIIYSNIDAVMTLAE